MIDYILQKKKARRLITSGALDTAIGTSFTFLGGTGLGILLFDAGELGISQGNYASSLVHSLWAFSVLGT